MDAEVKGLETGAVVFKSWGYSMVLPTWWKVLKGAAPGKFAVIQQLESKLESHDGYGQQGKKVPTDQLSSHYGPEKRKVYHYGNASVGVGTDHGVAELWDGKAKWYDSCD